MVPHPKDIKLAFAFKNHALSSRDKLVLDLILRSYLPFKLRSYTQLSVLALQMVTESWDGLANEATSQDSPASSKVFMKCVHVVFCTCSNLCFSMLSPVFHYLDIY